MGVIKVMGRIVNRLITVMLGLLLIVNLYTIGVRYFTGEIQPSVFGWSWNVVVSGSMEPNIRVNDLIVVNKQDDYELGDIISYKSGDSVITHRIVAETDKHYSTKGDFNNTPDSSPVPKDAVVGKVVFTIPKVGFLIGYLRTPLGMCSMVVVGVLIVQMPYLMDKLIKEKRRTQLI